jgi:type III restriction enzyme
MPAKYALLHKLLSKIAAARQQAKNTSFSLFEREARKTLDFETGFSFSAGMYDHLPMYHGAYKFKKHYLGNAKIPDGLNNEELECAKAIDEEPEVEFWLRNVDRQPLSFRLPTSTDWFYPDFLARLCDGRLLVVEYKGENLVSNDDTKEKANIGEIWAKLAKGKALFLLAVKLKDRKSLAEQIREKIEG